MAVVKKDTSMDLYLNGKCIKKGYTALSKQEILQNREQELGIGCFKRGVILVKMLRSEREEYLDERKGN